MSKKNKTKLIDLAADAGLAMISPLGFSIKKGVEFLLDTTDSNEEQNSLERYEEWLKFINDLSNYRESDRTALMFLSKSDAEQIWTSIFPGDLGIVCLDESEDLPENISIQGSLKTGILYLMDPRDENKYYPVDQIQHVLIKDHLLEMKNVFERLGAIRIDISYCGEEDENIMLSQNDSEQLKGSYGLHSASVGHKGSHNSTNRSKKYYQLEIHKNCAGKCIPINFYDCYWIFNDEAFRSEVQSIIDGVTTDVIFREVIKSYQSQMAFDLHKLETAYSYMESLNVNAECQWDSKSMYELSKVTVWDVHVTIADEVETVPQNITMQPQSNTLNDIDELDEPFYMYVEDVFKIPDLGTVITGRVASGVVRTGDTVFLSVDDKEVKTATIKGIEMFRKIFDRAERDDNIGLLVDGIDKSDIKIGAKLSKEPPIIDLSMPEQTCDKVLPRLTESEKEYFEEYQCVLEDGELTPRERKALERCRQRLGLSTERVEELEASVISMTKEEKEYIEEYRCQLEEGEIGDRERRSLERLRSKLGLTKEQILRLEKFV